MDKVLYHHDKSVFKDYKTGFWSDTYFVSWKNKYVDGDPQKGRVKWFWKINKPVQLTDAFHFFKMLMIIFICLSIITFDRCTSIIGCEYNILTFLFTLGVYGFLWNIYFSLFFDRILKSKE
jgi:hypothetical protein